MKTVSFRRATPTRFTISVAFNSVTRVIAGAVLLLSAQYSAALDIVGEWQQGAVIVGKVVPGTQVNYNNRKLSITGDGHFVLGLGRDAPARPERRPTPHLQSRRRVPAARSTTPAPTSPRRW